MKTPEIDWPSEQFWLNTWQAWRNGVLAAFLPHTVDLAAMNFQAFVDTCDAVRHPAFPAVFAGKSLAPDEFLIGYDRSSGAAPSFVLTNTRLFIRQTEGRPHVELPLDQITSFSNEGVWTATFHVSTADGRGWSFPKLDTVPKDAILEFAIERSRNAVAPAPFQRDKSWPVVVSGPSSGQSHTDVYVDTWMLARTGLAWPIACVACLGVGGLRERKLSVVLAEHTDSLERRTQYLETTYSICASCAAFQRQRSTVAFTVGVGFVTPFLAAVAALAVGSWLIVVAGIAGAALTFPVQRWLTRRAATGALPVKPLEGVDTWVQVAVLKGPFAPGIDRPATYYAYTTHRVRFRFANADYAARFASTNQGRR